MKFLADAQLPRRLCHRSRECGHDAVHTLDLRYELATQGHAFRSQSGVAVRPAAYRE